MTHWLLDTLMHKELDSFGNQGVDAVEYESLDDALQNQLLCHALMPDVRTIVVSVEKGRPLAPPTEDGMPPIVVHEIMGKNRDAYTGAL